MVEDFSTYRAHLWCRTLMKPVYPEMWEPGVHAYYRDGAAASYVVVGDKPDEGRFVKRLPGGQEQLIYWRIMSRSSGRPFSIASGGVRPG